MTFRPTALTFNNTTWRGAQPYAASDIPIPDYMLSSGVDRTILEQQFAYEWFDSSSTLARTRNPPFTKGSSGRLMPDQAGQRILRGFIRRAEYDNADPKSTARLYFMFNPETITRDYVSYLDQGALDPFNTVYQAGNLVPPPSFMDFTFSLLFDRQEEASQNPQFPGVFVDYEYFDLVVRNVVPNYDPNGVSTGGSELPDNGVMMVNPRDITVVFSPNITVQGRPSNARVTFQKFTHRMIPIRMQIDLTMRVTYFGPMKDMIEYKAEQATTTDTVPWNESGTELKINISNAQIKENYGLFLEQMQGGDLLTEEQIESIIQTYKDTGKLPDNIDDILRVDLGASGSLNESIADWGLNQLTRYHTEYTSTDRKNLWTRADCSSWVWGVYASHPDTPNVKMGGTWATEFKNGLYSGGSIPDTNTMLKEMATAPVRMIFQNRSPSQGTRSADITPNLSLVMKGDLLYRKSGVRSSTDKGHVAIVYANNSGTSIEIVHCGGPSPKPASHDTLPYSYVANNYTDCYRPMLGNPDSPGNRQGGG
jgi:hypothetical protein